MKGLSANGMELLKRICAAYAACPFETVIEDSFRPPGLCRTEVSIALHELLAAGFLKAQRKMWGGTRYQIPPEQLQQIHSLLYPFLPQAAEWREVELTKEAGPGLAADIFRSLLHLAREGLPLTAKGMVHKKSMTRLAAALTMREEHLLGVIKVNPWPDCPLPAVAAIDLLLTFGLISRETAGYRLEAGSMERWLHLTESRMSCLLYSAIVNRYGNPQPAMAHFRYLIARPEFPPGQWFCLTPLLQGLEETGLSGITSGHELKASCLSWLDCLNGFGWCELGVRSGEVCFRWSSAKPEFSASLLFSAPNGSDQSGPTSDGSQLDYSGLPSREDSRTAWSFVVQPDFEVLVPPEVPYYARWTLACMSQLLETDVMWSYKLTRERLDFASGIGMSPDESIAWLHQHTLEGLPECVHSTLRQWAAGIGQTSFAELTVLSCKTEEDGNTLAGHPRLRSILSRLGPLHFSVPRELVAQVRKELDAAGMSALPSVAGRDEEHRNEVPLLYRDVGKEFEALTEEETSEEFYFRQGLLGHAERIDRVDRADRTDGKILLDSLQKEALFPDIGDVPAMWCRDWRKYHYSTAEKVMEQGWKWGIKVRLSVEGEIRDFIPMQILGNPWRTRGYLLPVHLGAEDGIQASIEEEIELSARDWQEMKLMIPDFFRNTSSADGSDYGMINPSTARSRTLTQK